MSSGPCGAGGKGISLVASTGPLGTDPRGSDSEAGSWASEESFSESLTWSETSTLSPWGTDSEGDHSSPQGTVDGDDQPGPQGTPAGRRLGPVSLDPSQVPGPEVVPEQVREAMLKMADLDGDMLEGSRGRQTACPAGEVPDCLAAKCGGLPETGVVVLDEASAVLQARVLSNFYVRSYFFWVPARVPALSEGLRSGLRVRDLINPPALLHRQ